MMVPCSHGHGASGFCKEPQPGPGLENCCALRGHGRGTPGALGCPLGWVHFWMLGVDISAPRSSETAWDLLHIDGSQTQPRHERGVPGGHSGDPPPTGIPIPRTRDSGAPLPPHTPSSLQPSQSAAGTRKPELLWLCENPVHTLPQAGSCPGGSSPALPHSADSGHQQRVHTAKIRVSPNFPPAALPHFAPHNP